MPENNPYSYDANRSKTRYTDKTPTELDNPEKRKKLNPTNRYLLVGVIVLALALFLFALMRGFFR